MQSLRPAKIIFGVQYFRTFFNVRCFIAESSSGMIWVYIGLLDAILCNSAYSILGIPPLNLLLNAVLSLFMK